MTESTIKITLWRFNRCNELTRIIQECQPDEIYNLGRMSHVACLLIRQNMLEM